MATRDHENSSNPHSDEQLAALEHIYAQCPNPSASQRQQMKSEYLALKNIEDKQIKVWFQNRRSWDKQKNDNSDPHLLREKLTAANTILMQENEGLKKRVTELQHEHDYYLQRSRRTNVDNF